MEPSPPATKRGTFGKLGFVLAAAGSAVGLGNLWKFPHLAHKHGGGAFVLAYLGAVLLLGIPLLIAEITIGRATRANAVQAYRALGGKLWSGIGWLGIGTGIVLLAYYMVVAGWTIHYTLECLRWSFSGFSPSDASSLGPAFGAFLGNGGQQVLYQGLFMAATVGIIVFGVQKGIEASTKVMMPALFLILLTLLGVAATIPSFGEALAHLFTPGEIGPKGILAALGQAFFSLSIGMGIMVTYGSYMPKSASIPRSSIQVALLDTTVALLASVIIFTIMFSIPAELRAEKFGTSAGLLFTTMPEMLYGLPLGRVLAPAFFILIAFAALTSTISLLEVLVCWLIDATGLKRAPATVIMGLACFALGVPAALSLGAHAGLSSFAPLGDRATGVFDLMDFLVSNYGLPIGGLLVAVFVGWVLSEATTRATTEEGHGAFKLHGLWRLSLKVVCPAAIGWILYSVLFLGVKFN